jgi:hypothetical protein
MGKASRMLLGACVIDANVRLNDDKQLGGTAKYADFEIKTLKHFFA